MIQGPAETGPRTSANAEFRIPVEPQPPLYGIEFIIEILPELPDSHVAILEVVDHFYACAGAVLPKEAVEAVTLEDFEQVLEVVANEVHVVELVVVEHGAAAFSGFGSHSPS